MTRAVDADAQLHEYLSARRKEIEAALERYAPDPLRVPAVVAEAMQYSLMSGGKRLRPLLTLVTAEAVSAASETPTSRSAIHPAAARSLAMPAACAIEMIHTYSLVHDDLPAMDDDTLRRGRPTLHVVAGDGMAILAGDGLQAEAFRILATEPASEDPEIADRKLRVLALVADAAGPCGMVGGQAIDLAAVRPGPGRQTGTLDAATLEDMHRRKTGALIRASAMAGAIMAGAGDSLTRAIDRYGSAIGLAFQIVDDLLDVEAESEELGKATRKDARLGKPTYPSLHGLARSRALAGDCLDKAQAALADVGLADSPLAGIARMIVNRRS